MLFRQALKNTERFTEICERDEANHAADQAQGFISLSAAPVELAPWSVIRTPPGAGSSLRGQRSPDNGPGTGLGVTPPPEAQASMLKPAEVVKMGRSHDFPDDLAQQFGMVSTHVSGVGLDGIPRKTLPLFAARSIPKASLRFNRVHDVFPDDLEAFYYTPQQARNKRKRSLTFDADDGYSNTCKT